MPKPRTSHAPTLADRVDLAHVYTQINDRKIHEKSLLHEKFPRYFNETVDGFCAMQAGDVLYMPGCFFHEVESFGARHLAINFWFKFTGKESIDIIDYEKAKSLIY